MKRAIGVKIKLICLSGAVLLILGSAPAQAQICEAAGGAKCLYVAPGGSDSNPGTFAAPFKTFRPALGSA
ncbi:MAG: hypothetical protein HY551_03705, partial [Elusimicrobia bacterium]|nr:hypothetical protein [Elusimicrobiota bacterium]